MKRVLWLTCIAVALTACSQKDGPDPVKAEGGGAVPMASPSNPPSTQAPAPMPAPGANADSQIQPKPGQANDHSNPAFQGGGQTETQKK